MGCLNLRSLLIRPVGGTADDDVDSNCLLTTVFCALRAALLAVPVSPPLYTNTSYFEPVNYLLLEPKHSV